MDCFTRGSYVQASGRSVRPYPFLRDFTSRHAKSGPSAMWVQQHGGPCRDSRSPTGWTNWDWTPSNKSACGALVQQVRTIDAIAVCRALRGRHVAFIGDSLNGQLFLSLAYLAGLSEPVAQWSAIHAVDG